MKTYHILLGALLPISLLLVSCEIGTPTTVDTISVVANPSFHQADEEEIENEDSFDMNDRLSGSGASGDGEAKLEDGELELELEIEDLIAGHPYEVHVIVGPEGGDFDPANSTIHVFPVTADEDGELRFKVEFDLGLDPGFYRLDYVVIDPAADLSNFPDFLLVACLPASFFTIGGDDDEEDDD